VFVVAVVAAIVVGFVVGLAVVAADVLVVGGGFGFAFVVEVAVARDCHLRSTMEGINYA